MKFVSTPSTLWYCLTAVSQHRQTWHWQAQNKIRALHIRALTDAGELPQLYKTHPDVSALAFHVTLSHARQLKSCERMIWSPAFRCVQVGAVTCLLRCVCLLLSGGVCFLGHLWAVLISLKKKKDKNKNTKLPVHQ